MEELSNKGVYSISKRSKEFLSDFYGNYANINEVYEAIKELYNNEGYLMDTHTAVGYVVLNKYRKETSDYRQALVASTASPYKFPRSICNALGFDISEKDEFEILNILSTNTNTNIPNNLKNLDKKEVLHKEICDKDKMKESLIDFLSGAKND